MAGMSLPSATKKIIAIPAKDDLAPLLKVCEGNDFDSIRDMAIFRVLADCGLRLSECAGPICW
jgi:site-specific recombinase XerC